jgi:hypothetical protein
MNRRMATIYNFLLKRDAGCIKFEYGRDWHTKMTEEEIEFVDKSFNVYLENKLIEVSK